MLFRSFLTAAAGLSLALGAFVGGMLTNGKRGIADVPLFVFHLLEYAGVDFTLFQCTDAALAILAGVIGGVVAQHFGYAACFLFAGAFTLLAAWVAYIRLHSARELMTSAID